MYFRKFLNYLINFLTSNSSSKISIISHEKRDGKTHFGLKINSKCTPSIWKTPYELIMESYNGGIFSRDELRMVLDGLIADTKNMVEAKYKPKYSIINHNFSNEVQEPLILIRCNEDNSLAIKSVKDIFLHANKIADFSPIDCMYIGYVMGQMEYEKKI